MSRIKNKIFLTGFFLLLCYTASGENLILLEPPPVFDNNAAFNALLKKDPASKAFEVQKIEYLLNRITQSSCIFIRNGQKYTGAVAVLHMRWKYARYHHEIKTAKDFAEKIANASRKTREKYKVKLKNGTVHNAADILLNELRQLDQALEKARQPKAESVIEPVKNEATATTV